MTDRELMQMALDAMRAVSVDEHLCNAAHHVKKDRHGIDEPCPIAKRFNDIAEALRARLAQPEPEPEPVAWMHDSHVGFNVPLYTAPPQRECVSCAGLCCQDYEKCNLPCTPRGREQARREWQTLTENEIKHLWYEACQTNLELTSQLIVHLARNIEAKLKEKNG